MIKQNQDSRTEKLNHRIVTYVAKSILTKKKGKKKKKKKTCGIAYTCNYRDSLRHF